MVFALAGDSTITRLSVIARESSTGSFAASQPPLICGVSGNHGRCRSRRSSGVPDPAQELLVELLLGLLDWLRGSARSYRPPRDGICVGRDLQEANLIPWEVEERVDVVGPDRSLAGGAPNIGTDEGDVA